MFFFFNYRKLKDLMASFCPQHPTTFLSSRRLSRPADSCTGAATKSPSSTCPSFLPDPNTYPRPSPEQTGIIPRAWFPLQGEEAGQGGGRRSLPQETVQEHSAAPIIWLQMLSPCDKVPPSNGKPPHTPDPARLLLKFPK